MNQINFKELPFYIKFTFKLLMILLLGLILIQGQTIIVPFIFSILLSILLLPVTNFLEFKLHIPRSIANLSAVVFSLFIIGWIIYFFSREIAGFLLDIPSIKSHLEVHYETLQIWIQETFHISPRQQTFMLNNATKNVQNSSTTVIGETFFTITNTFFFIIIIAIYTFLILFYRHMIKAFILEIFTKKNETVVKEVLFESKAIVQKYMVGLVIEMAIIAVLNTCLFFIIGIKYAVFLGILTAILNIIPYIGIISGIIFTSLITLTTSTHLSDIVWIIIGLEVIHFFDANFLMPRIVGSKVKINALVTILGVVIGGSLLGLSGIFLALPTIAILKVIFDRIDDLKPLGKLMGGDNSSNKSRLLKQIEKLRLKKESKIIANQV